MHNTIHRWTKPLRVIPQFANRFAHAPDEIDLPLRNGQPHIFNTLHYPSTTLGNVLDQSADRFGDIPALIYGDVHWTYRDLLREVNRLAAGLAALGVRKGDRVLFMIPNCPEFVTAFMAVQKLGAVVVNAGPLMGSEDLKRLLPLTQPRIAIALDLQASLLARISNGQSDFPWVSVSLKDYQTVWKRLGYWAKLRQAQQGNGHNGSEKKLEQLLNESPSRPPTVAPHHDEIAVLQPTGGTTGSLKVAQLTHHNLLANAMQLTVSVRCVPGQDRVLAVLPMFHVYGLSTCLVTSLLNATTILPVTRFNVDQLLDVISEHRPTVLPLAPAIIEPLCDRLSQRPRPDVIEALQSATVTSGAAPLMPATAQRFETLTGIRIVQGYGLTEASPVTHANPTDEPRLGSIGLPLPDTRARVVDLQDPTCEAEAGEPGELLVSGPQVMTGYFQNADETQRVLSVDKQGQTWLHTGDVVRVDEDGYFYVVDRCKDMINCGGLKVYPNRVEQVLKMNPQVADVAVIGRPDPVKTEIAVALIVLKDRIPDTDQLVTELRAQCREHLARYEVPQSFEFVDALPRTALGKLQRYQLRQQEEIGSMPDSANSTPTDDT